MDAEIGEGGQLSRSAELKRDWSRERPGARAPLALLLLALVVGIVVDRFCDFSVALWFGLGALATAGWLVSFAFHRIHEGTACLLTLAFGVAGVWHHAFWNDYAVDHVSRFACTEAAPVCCETRVLSTPKVLPARHDPLQPYFDEERTQFAVEVLSVRSAIRETHGLDVADGYTWDEVSGTARVFVNGRLEGVRAGARIRVFGKLSRLSDRQNPGGHSPLDRGRSERCVCRLVVSYPDCVQVIRARSPLDMRWWMEALHDGCRAQLCRYLEHDSAQLAAAVLLGDREYLDPNEIDSFFVTGTIHLLAISGLHLAIVVGAFFFVARVIRLPRRQGLVLVMVLTILYAMLTGGRPPVIRATVLVCVLCMELLFFRPRVSFNSLAAAGIVILVLNPTGVFHAGVQLSFLAVATLIWLARLQRALELAGREPTFTPKSDDASLLPYVLDKLRRHFWHAVLAGCAIWFVSIPLVMHRFHLVPASGLVLNFFLLAPLSLALYCGLLVMLFGWWLPPLAAAFAWGCESSLGLITGIVHWAERFELSYGWVAGPTLLGLLLFYAVLVGFGAFQRWHHRWPLWLASAFTILAATSFATGDRGKDDGAVECAFLSIGHGVCIVLQLPDNEVWLYDAGSLGSTRSALREISSFLWSRRITRLDGIVLSHSDTDHFNVVPQLLKRFKVGEICTSSAMFQSTDGAVAELIKHLDAGTVPVRFVSRGARLAESALGSVIVRHPKTGRIAEEDNANSIVLEVVYFGKRILLTGDLEGAGLASLLMDEPLDCDIMMAPHHGSRHSRPADVVQWCDPEWVVVSGGDLQRSREAMEVYQRAGARVLHTADQGAVMAVLAPNHVSVSGFSGLRQGGLQSGASWVAALTGIR